MTTQVPAHPADSVRHGWVFPLAAAVGAGTFFGIVKLIVWLAS